MITEKENAPVLIVGQGLAGSILAHQLYSKNISFHIIDNSHYASASLAAGGIMHPMSFKRLILTWQAKKLIPYAKEFYNSLDKSFNTSTFSDDTLYRPFASIEEQNDWYIKMKEPEFADVISIYDDVIKGIKAPFGIGAIRLSGRLNTAAFLNQTKTHFNSNISQEVFDHSLLAKKDKLWSYKGEEYKAVIFCDGFQYNKNPYFNYLPNNFTQGEIIKIRKDDFSDKMISRGCFIVPTDQKEEYIIGSTYVWNPDHGNTTQKGKEELLAKVQKVSDSESKVVDHLAGIRPTTHDRRPLIGEHPEHKGLFIFNGMGSKTVMIAPYLSNELIELIEKGKSLDPEADIKRLEKKYYHKRDTNEAAKMS